MSRDLALHLKYRPKHFVDVLGQDPVIQSLQGMIADGAQQAYLFAGPSGVGKTTLARISAKALGCDATSIHDVDAATYSGVDDMRELTSMLQYGSLSERAGRAVIVDECHSLSSKAWQSLLRSVEEPPAHAYWFFCTTEVGKVPATIKTRCAVYNLQLVSEHDLDKLFCKVAEAERMNFSDDSCDLIIREANGSPRQLLVNMDKCRGAKTKKEVAAILRSAIGSVGAIELCRLLNDGGSWAKAMAVLGKLTENPESVRIVVVNYFAKAGMNAKDAKKAGHAARIIDCFAEPYNPSDHQAPLVLSLARALLE